MISSTELKRLIDNRIRANEGKEEAEYWKRVRDYIKKYEVCTQEN